MGMVAIGFGNVVLSEDILSIVDFEQSTAKKTLAYVKERNMLVVDASSGKKIRSILISKSGIVILSAVKTETIKNRIESKLYVGDRGVNGNTQTVAHSPDEDDGIDEDEGESNAGGQSPSWENQILEL